MRCCDFHKYLLRFVEIISICIPYTFPLTLKGKQMAYISNTDDVIDSRDVIARLEELTESSAAYVAGWNMPGYMPDSEPARFQTWEDAAEYIGEEMARAAESLMDLPESALESETLTASAIHIRSAAEMPKGYGETIGNYHYWIEPLSGSDRFESPEDAAEHAALLKLAEEAAQYAPDWEHGETLIRDSYFKEYAQELAEDCAPFPRNSPEGKALEMWPYRCTDWDQAARELQMDYTAVDFDGVTYWIR